MENRSSFWKVLGELLVYSVIGVFFVFVSTTILKSVSSSKKEDIEPVVREIIREHEVVIKKPECDHSIDGFNSLKNKGQYIRLVTNATSFGRGGSFVSNIEPTAMIEGDDEVACGYLLIRASKSGKKLDDEYETIYINPQEFGGHILLNRNISSNINGTTSTEVLIPLDVVSYLEGLPYDPLSKDYRIANWVNLLNVNSHVTFGIGLSTIDESGLIEEVSIAYKCWNPTTGKESIKCQIGLKP